MRIGSRSGVHRVSSARVLIVEDDEDCADLFAGWLQDFGLSVSIASDAERGLALAPVIRPALIVIDLGLPTTDGIVLMQQLREVPELACQYIAVTAYSGARLPLLCQAAGFGAFFQKPVTRSAFIECVVAMTKPPERRRCH